MSIDDSRGAAAQDRGRSGSTSGGPSVATPKAQSDLQTAKHEAKAAAEEIKHTAAAAAEDVKHEAGRLVGDLTSAGKYAARDAKDAAVDTAKSLTDRKTSEAATQVMHFSKAMHDAADRLREEEHTTAAGYVGTAARVLDRAAEYLDQAKLETLMKDAERFAHRRPEVFVGGLLVAGLGLARFLKASKPRRQYEQAEPNHFRSRQEIDLYGGTRFADGRQYQAAVARPVSDEGAVAVTRFDRDGSGDVLVASPATDIPNAARPVEGGVS